MGHLARGNTRGDECGAAGVASSPVRTPCRRIRKGGIRETTEQFEAPPFTGNVPARWMLVGK